MTARSIFGLLTLFCGFLQAPFNHIHLEELDHPNAGPAHVHFYIESAETGQHLEAPSADDDALDVLWTISAPPVIHLHFDLALAPDTAIEPRLIADSVVTAVALHSHDPPELTPRHLRGPPA